MSGPQEGEEEDWFGAATPLMVTSFACWSGSFNQADRSLTQATPRHASILQHARTRCQQFANMTSPISLPARFQASGPYSTENRQAVAKISGRGLAC